MRTEHGDKPIEQVKAGEKVLSADPKTGKQSYQRVEKTYVRHTEVLYVVTLADGRKLETTSEHPFWVEGKGFVAAKRLARSDLLREANGHRVAVASLTYRYGHFTVYNFTVARTHTYYAAGVWVHNADCPFTWLLEDGEHGIMGELEDGVVHFVVEAGERSPVRGTQLFDTMMEHFGADARAVQGNWTSGDNLGMVNRLTSQGMPLEEAIRHTWTGTRAARLGFTETRLLGAQGNPGAYTKVYAQFWR